MHLKSIKEFYNEFYAYLKKDLERPNPRHLHVYQSLKDLLRPNISVLDLGCGLGLTTHFMRQSGCRALGVDLSERLVSEARRHFGGDFICADLCTLSLKKKFEVVTLIDCLEHLPPERRPLVWEVVRQHLKPDGLLYLNLPAPAFQLWDREHRPQSIQIVDESVPLEEIAASLGEHGFTLLSLITYGIDVPEQYVEITARYGFSEKLKTHLWQKLAAAPLPVIEQTAAAPPEVPSQFRRTQPRPQQTPKRVGFFAGDEGNFHFVQDIAQYAAQAGLATRFFPEASHSAEKLASALSLCDVAWFEWANGPIIPATHLPKTCRIICRLHKYEAYSDLPRQIQWDKVDHLVFISPGVLAAFKEHINPHIEELTHVKIIPNTVNPARFSFNPEKSKGFNLAWVGRLHSDKNPALVLQIMAELKKRDPRYRCFMIGRSQDKVLESYINFMIQEMKLENQVIYQGATSDVISWLSDKSFLLNTSVVEGHPVAVLEAMLLGIKPVIHNFVGGATEMFSPDMVYNTAAEAVELVLSEHYHPEFYRNFVEKRYPFQHMMEENFSLINAKPGMRMAPKISRNKAPTLFSVIIPSFNRAGFLQSAIKSVLNQPGPSFEIVVIDDGSTDNTPAVMSAFDDPRVRYLRKEHSGAPDSRNQGIGAAQGEWLLWLDSDDLILPGWLARLHTILETGAEADVYYGNLEVVDAQSRRLHIIRYDDFAGKNALLVSRLVHGNPLPLPGSLMRKALLERVGGFDLEFTRAHDYELWTRLAPAARFRHVPFLAVQWRWHDANMSSGSVHRDLAFEAKVVQRLLTRHPLTELFPDLPWQDWQEAQSQAARQLGEIFSRYGDHKTAGEWLAESQELDPSMDRMKKHAAGL
jgi:glycosyltransferase involved in cell wall biosynthesis/GT2 family glycosyltransferase